MGQVTGNGVVIYLNEAETRKRNGPWEFLPRLVPFILLNLLYSCMSQEDFGMIPESMRNLKAHN